MYRLFIEDLSNFRLFLSLTDTEYVDALLKEGSSSIINNSGELFGCITLKTECSVSDTGLHCRIPRKLLSNLAENGTIDVRYDESKITLVFRNTKKICKVSFTRQDIFTENYVHKLKVITKLDGKTELDISKISLLNRIGKSNKTIISHNLGVVGMKLPFNCRIYQKQNLGCNFSVLAADLQVLKNVGGSIFSIENYMGAERGNLIVLATKTRDDVNDEFGLIEQERSKFKCVVDLQALVNFFIKVKPKVDFVELDLEERVVQINQNRLEYEIPIEVENLLKSEKATFNTIKIPACLILSVFNHLPNFKCSLEQKKNFVRLENSELIILL